MIEILLKDFIIVLMIFIRVLAAFIAAPIFGHKAIPATVKVFLSFIVAYIIFTTIDTSYIIVNDSMGFIISNGIKEVITGLIIGFAFNLVFHGISFAGSIIGFDVGLSMANVLNPMDDSQNNVIAEFIFYLAMFTFFLINGHHYVIKALHSSVIIVPIGKFSITTPVFDLLLKYSGAVFLIAIQIASPILVSFFLIHIAEGITARVIPQMQVFFVTQPLKIGVGLVLVSFLIPTYLNLIKSLLSIYEDNIFQLIKAMR